MLRSKVASSDPHISPVWRPAPHLADLQLVYRPRTEIRAVTHGGWECREGEGNAPGSAPLARHRAAVVRVEERAVELERAAIGSEKARLCKCVADKLTNHAEAAAIRRGAVGLRIEHMCARRVGLHDREPVKRHLQRCAREDCVNTGGENREEARSGGEIVLFPLGRGGLNDAARRRRREGHDAEREVQTARLDDDGGVEPIDRWVLREPGGRERLHSAAEVGVVADGEREEVGRAWCRAFLLGVGVL